MKNALKMIRMHKFNALSLAVFLLLAGFLLLSAFCAETIFDEFYYQTVAQRFFAGDRLIVDEWYVIQLSSLFLLLPYKIFTSLTGGTEGIILFCRCIFISLDMALYWFLCLRFRKKTAAAPIAAGLFCADIFAGIITLNYYNISLHALAVAAMLLLTPDRRLPAGKIVFAGFVFAVAVMLEPGFCAVYLLFSVAALLREAFAKAGKHPLKKWDFILNGRTWLFVTLGAGICAALLLTFLALTSGLGDTLRYLPESLSGSEYDLRWYGNSETPEKINRIFSVYTLPAAMLLAALPPAAAIIKKKNAGRRAKAVIFFSALFLCGAACLLATLGSDPLVCQVLPFPCTVCSLVFYILCDKKDPHVFAFWLLAAFCSAAADFLSSTSLFFTFRLAYFPAVYFGAALYREILPKAHPAAEAAEPNERQTDGKERNTVSAAKVNSRDPGSKARVFRIISGVLAVFALLNAGFQLLQQTDYTLLSKIAGAVVVAQSGPEKGLLPLRTVDETRQKRRTDLDYISAHCEGPLYVVKRLPECYLYLNELPIAAYSACYSAEEVMTKQIRYWREHPEKLPEYLYAPYNEERGQSEELRELLQYCTYNIVGGRSGYIVRVLAWRLPGREDA